MELLVCVKVERKKFKFEDYMYQDNVLGLVKSGSFSISDGREKAVIEAGNATVFKAGVIYHREVIEPVVMYFFRFRTNHAINTPLKIEFKDKEHITSTLNLLEKLDENIYPDDFKYRRNILSYIMTQYYIENGIEEQAGHKHDSLMKKAMRILENNIHNKISLSDVSDDIGMSYVHFTRRFKSYTGLSPSDYIAQARMKKAKEFLADTDLLIKDIAVHCGFDNEYYFSNFFKKHSGVSPSEFRQNMI